MGMSADEYLAMLVALKPKGLAWPTNIDALQNQLLAAFAEEFARLDARVDDLIIEADPRTTTELLEEWESDYGLPDPCAATADTIAERRNTVHAKRTIVANPTPQFYINLAASLGYTVTITETPDSHTWTVHSAETTVTNFVAGGSTAGDPLTDWGNELLECAITRLKPAHTTVLFAYGA